VKKIEKPRQPFLTGLPFEKKEKGEVTMKSQAPLGLERLLTGRRRKEKKRRSERDVRGEKEIDSRVSLKRTFRVSKLRDKKGGA